MTTLGRTLAQHEREMLVGAFLDITAAQWKAWVQRTGDDAIPEELHQHVVAILLGLEGAEGRDYRDYLQALCLLSDDSLLHLVREVGNSPL